jgi:hypothetical protein
VPTQTPTRTLPLRPSLDWLLVLVPAAIVLEFAGGPDLAIWSNWLEGAQLMGAYGIMAISFSFVQ